MDDSRAGMPHHVASAVGAYGEQVAERHLVERGLRILERNWRCPLGEIDLVAQEGKVLVVCEVKTRRSAAFGPPAEAVTPRKLARLRHLAAEWLRERGGGFAEVRVDVVAVLHPRNGPCEVEHLIGVG